MSKLRQQSVESVDEVRWAFMESDGQISVRRYAGEGRHAHFVKSVIRPGQ